MGRIVRRYRRPVIGVLGRVMSGVQRARTWVMTVVVARWRKVSVMAEEG